jgi:beta-galactosidase
MRNYDFYAPLSEYGHVHGHYHLLRRLHIFVANFNAWLAPKPNFLPAYQPTSVNDTTTLRWSVRSDGTSGAIFVNQYQRHTTMADITGARLNLTLAGGSVLTIPSPASPALTIPGGSYFVWPFNFPVANTGLVITYALAMPLTALPLPDGSVLLVFGATTGIAPELAVSTSNGAVTQKSCAATCTQENGNFMVRGITPGTAAVASFVSPAPGSRVVTVVVLDEASALQAYTGEIAGTPSLILADGPVLLDPATPDTLRIRTEAVGSSSFAVVPAVPSRVILAGQTVLSPAADGVFTRFTFPVPAPQLTVSFTQVAQAGPARKVPIGPAGVAEAPDADGSTTAFAAAAIWNVTITATGGAAPGPQLLPRLVMNYTGDCARVYYNGTILADDFYNADIFVLGLARYGPSFFGPNGQVTVQLYILPLSSDAPIYLYDWPNFNGQSTVLSLNSIDVVQVFDASIAVGQ